ncbi:hypothetical protein L226DRAFT_568548 [Lentinus tigrinus ALCF2SS1-7]|uniref:uncharacterized protein n=1 Tax=Lentinus tigrinus ALCF2SS1-7 TaxID=1328758 RepID=UPI001165D0FB|nr:hypothetical protein L226DRAFT_568548 [Lentinus tigrinus ALCF2SS1-7]
MMMNALYAVLALAAAALATPLAMTPRDSVSPPITNPTAQTVWRVGDTVTVEWDVAALNGAQPSNPLAKIILGTLADNVEHLMIESPLVSNFPILGGNVSLVVPSVPSGSDYIVCLFGTSGDISPAFTIVGTDASSTLGQTLAASSSNTLPPHQTTDPSTTVSLPPTGVTRTDPASSATSSVSATTSASVSVTSGILPSGVSGTSGSVTAPGTSASATSTSASSTSSSAATGGAGNFGSRVSVTGAHIFGVVSAAMTLLTFL